MLCGQIGGWFATRAAERRSYLASSCQNLPLATPHTSLNFQTTRRCQVTPSLSSVWKSTESQTFEVLAEACRISDPGRQGGFETDLIRLAVRWNLVPRIFGGTTGYLQTRSRCGMKCQSLGVWHGNSGESWYFKFFNKLGSLALGGLGSGAFPNEERSMYDLTTNVIFERTHGREIWNPWHCGNRRIWGMRFFNLVQTN
jgi:hypothetical protein